MDSEMPYSPKLGIARSADHKDAYVTHPYQHGPANARIAVRRLELMTDINHDARLIIAWFNGATKSVQA